MMFQYYHWGVQTNYYVTFNLYFIVEIEFKIHLYQIPFTKCHNYFVNIIKPLWKVLF